METGQLWNTDVFLNGNSENPSNFLARINNSEDKVNNLLPVLLLPVLLLPISRV